VKRKICTEKQLCDLLQLRSFPKSYLLLYFKKTIRVLRKAASPNEDYHPKLLTQTYFGVKTTENYTTFKAPYIERLTK